MRYAYGLLLLAVISGAGLAGAADLNGTNLNLTGNIGAQGSKFVFGAGLTGLTKPHIWFDDTVNKMVHVVQPNGSTGNISGFVFYNNIPSGANKGVSQLMWVNTALSA